MTTRKRIKAVEKIDKITNKTPHSFYDMSISEVWHLFSCFICQKCI